MLEGGGAGYKILNELISFKDKLQETCHGFDPEHLPTPLPVGEEDLSFPHCMSPQSLQI